MSHYTGLIEKYRDRLPVAPNARVISLGEGGTRLIELKNLPSLIRKKVRIFAKFDAGTRVLPGHGTATTVGDESPHLQEWVERGQSACGLWRLGIVPDVALLSARRPARADLALKVAHELAGLEGLHGSMFRLGGAYEAAPVINGVRMHRSVPEAPRALQRRTEVRMDAAGGVH